ncbi:MAG: chemotaxis protein CheD [Deltaproteobacteria bacterium]|nr:chemotaxis protein CheD [Deltaproteobacteria bacterium]
MAKGKAETLITVDIADMKISNDIGSTLVTYALGSCIAVILYDPVQRCGGMIHYMLPLSNKSPEKAANNPAMFADTGIPKLFEKMYELGCRKENIIVKVAGGGQLYDDKGTFNIGKRNYTVMRKMFWKNNIIVSAEDVGGAKSRTAKLRIADGRVTIKVKGVEEVL